VLTIELDSAATEIARANPWSREMFEDERIEWRIGDSFEVVPELPDASFEAVIHDPPQFSLAGELYSLEFYRQVHRMLAPGGKLFHYIGDPESKMSGNVTRGVLRRLEEAGFRGVKRRPQAFGVSAVR
jgi:predicted methyltransferase